MWTPSTPSPARLSAASLPFRPGWKTSTPISSKRSSSGSAMSAANCTPAAAATIRLRPTCGYGCGTRLTGLIPSFETGNGPCWKRLKETATWCCPATRTSSGPSPSWRLITSWLTWRSTNATATGWPMAAGGSTCCPWAPPHWPALLFPSTATVSAGNSASKVWRTTVSTPPATAISCWSLSSPYR